jgi:hypothetical protein
MNIWKPVRGFFPYEVSNEGVVRNPETGKLSIWKNHNGSECIYLNRKTITLTKLMRENYPYEWIKELEEGEEVKPLKEYPGYYITSYGRVWGMKQYRFLTPNKVIHKQHTNNPYWKLGISISGKVKYYQLHTLVGRYFLPEYREGLCILHKEETLSYPEINYVENLWVGTKEDNNKDRDIKGRVKRGEGGKYVKNMV